MNGGLSEASRAGRWVLFLSGAALCVSLVFSSIWHFRPAPLPYDDAFISYRYVKNLLAGKGLVYNQGEPVFGSSSPLYVLWLSTVAGLTRQTDIPAVSVAGNALFYVLTALAVTGLVHQLTRTWAVGMAVGALFAISPEILDVSLGGMESTVFLCLMVATVWGLAAGRLRISFALAALSVLTRPEGLIMMGLCGLSWLVRPGHKDWQAPTIGGLIVLPWLAFATIAYGTPVPHSIVAKSAPLYLLPRGFALNHIWKLLTMSSGLDALAPQGKILLVGLTILGSLAGALLGDVSKRGGAWLAATLWLLVAFYAVTNPLMFEWYYPPLWVFWTLTVLMGAWAFVRQLARAMRIPAWVRAAGVALLVGGSLAIVVHTPVKIYSGWALRGEPVGLPFLTAPRLRVMAYREASSWVNQHGSETSTTLAAEVGAYGYYYNGYVFDACGLVSPQAMPYLPVPWAQRRDGATAAISKEFARLANAEYVVAMPIFTVVSTDLDPWFRSNYALVHTIKLAGNVWGAREVMIWERKPRR